VFPADLLELPWRPFPAPIDDTLTRRLVAQQQDFRRVGRWSDWVAMVLRESEGCQPTRDELAGLLYISRATLARRLAAEGTSYRRLGIRIRHQRACELLACSTDPVSHIAYRLGYTEVANFSHAFRAVAGVCPGSYRAEHSALE
jgi:AraC-like DNA-binding protein